MNVRQAPGGFASRLPITDGRLNICTCAGIGDFLWTWSKLWKLAEERDTVFWFPNEEIKRAGAVAQMLGAKYGYLPGLSSQAVWEYWDEHRDPEIPDSGGTLVVSANRWLERGMNLTRWYPDLPYRNPTPSINKVNYHQETKQARYVTVFMSMHGYMERGGNLLPGQWARLCQEIEQKIAPVLIVGAGEDVKLVEDVCEIFSPTLVPALNVPLPDLIPALKGASGMLAVASGLSILSTYAGVPTFQCYPRWLSAMPTTWPDEQSITDWCFLDEATMPGTVDRLAALIERKNEVTE